MLRKCRSSEQWGCALNRCSPLSVRSSGVPPPGAKAQCQGDLVHVQTMEWRINACQKCTPGPIGLGQLYCENTNILSAMHVLWPQEFSLRIFQLCRWIGNQHSWWIPKDFTFAMLKARGTALWGRLTELRRKFLFFLSLGLCCLLAWSISCRNSVYLAAKQHRHVSFKHEHFTGSWDNSESNTFWGLPFPTGKTAMCDSVWGWHIDYRILFPWLLIC